MVTAVIDLGTNTFHLLIVDIRSDSDQIILHKEKVAVRLGQNGISKGLIDEEALIRAIETLRHFRRIMDVHNPQKVTATATSAVRNARNGSEFVDLAFKETDIKIVVLSGKEEARYIYEGVKRYIPLGDRPSLIIDIGGGSVEFIIADEKEAYWMQSYEIGGQRLMDMFHLEDPMPQKNINSMVQFLDQTLVELYQRVQEYAVKSLVGSSGTFDTLQDIASYDMDAPKENSFELSIDMFKNILIQLTSKTREERLQIPGMIPMRVDMIVVASILTNHVIEKSRISKIKTSKYALKEGVLYSGLETTTQ